MHARRFGQEAELATAALARELVRWLFRQRLSRAEGIAGRQRACVSQSLLSERDGSQEGIQNVCSMPQ